MKVYHKHFISKHHTTSSVFFHFPSHVRRLLEAEEDLSIAKKKCEEIQRPQHMWSVSRWMLKQDEEVGGVVPG